MRISRYYLLSVFAVLGVGALGFILVRSRQMHLTVLNRSTNSVATGASGNLLSVVYPNTYDDPQPFIQGLYAADHRASLPVHPRIRAVIVPHHLVASASIAAGIRALRGEHFSRIILLSPDHFHQCRTVLCTVNATYHTFFGDVSASRDVVAELSSSSLVTIQPDLFKREHGIFAVVPFVAHDFPGVPVTPIAMSQDLPWRSDETALSHLFDHLINRQTILIVSSDFSHYLSLPQAQQMDAQTQKTIASRNVDAIARLQDPAQSDCPGCLWTLASLASQQQFYHPVVLMHTNSATLLHDSTVPKTTSHFSMIWYEQTPSSTAMNTFY